MLFNIEHSRSAPISRKARKFYGAPTGSVPPTNGASLYQFCPRPAQWLNWCRSTPPRTASVPALEPADGILTSTIHDGESGFKVAQLLIHGSSCKTTFSSELWISRLPL